MVVKHTLAVMHVLLFCSKTHILQGYNAEAIKLTQYLYIKHAEI